MKRTTLLLGILLSMPGAGAIIAEVTAVDAFETLKSMAGTWRGPMEGVGEEAEAEAAAAGEAVHEIQVSAAGTVVMETMGPGTDHEMINMYHLDGDDLVLTHYCAGGNQPRMRLDREIFSAERLVFEFDGGTNLDPEADHFIHDMELGIESKSAVVSTWNSWAAGAPGATMVFHLRRGE